MYSANNILYEWLECISMGSFLGTSLSNVITTDPEQKVIRKFVNNDIHKFYEHFCSVLNHPEHVDRVHKALTKFEKKLNFTVVHSTAMCHIFKAYVRYFSLFLKEQCTSWLFWTKCFEKKFNLQLFYLLIVSRTLILTWANMHCPPS